MTTTELARYRSLPTCIISTSTITTISINATLIINASSINTTTNTNITRGERGLRTGGGGRRSPSGSSCI